MRVVKQDGKLVVHSTYAEKDELRRVKGGTYDSKTKTWSFPLEAARDLITKIPSMQWDETIETIAKACELVDAKVHDLCKGITEPREHPFLMLHQRIGRDIALYKKRFCLFYDVGTGKTVMGYSIIAENPHLKWVVITPRAIIKTAWIADWEEFFKNDMKVFPHHTDLTLEDCYYYAGLFGMDTGRMRKAELVKALLKEADVVVTNIENFKASKELDEITFTGMIIDESSIMKNGNSQNTKKVIVAAKQCERVYPMSGKPAPNNEMEYFSQMQVVDPTLFGTSFYSFRMSYFEAKDYFQTKWSLKVDRAEEFVEKLSHCAIFMPKEKCIELPPEIPPMIRTVQLTGEALKYYREMEKQQCLTLELEGEKREITTAVAVGKIMKLRQITSGFIIDTEEKETLPLHGLKIAALKDLLTELGDNKAVIWINFKEEAREISKLMSSMGLTFSSAHSGAKNVDTEIEDFQKNKTQFMIAHPKSIKYGVTFTGNRMVKNCTYAIYYSMSNSFEDFYQSKHRILRKGQTESCTFIFLCAENTIDTDIYDSIVRKGTNALIIENLVRRHKEVGKHGRRSSW